MWYFNIFMNRIEISVDKNNFNKMLTKLTLVYMVSLMFNFIAMCY